MQGKNLTYVERCQMLNTNPVVVAKHFQHRVEVFFSEVLLSNINPIGKISYYALRIEFQMRGSPHLHALIWTSDCPNLRRFLDVCTTEIRIHIFLLTLAFLTLPLPSLAFPSLPYTSLALPTLP